MVDVGRPAPGGSPVLVIEHEKDCPPALFGSGLAAAGVRTEIVRPYLGDPVPADPGPYAGLVVLGGAMAAWEDEVAPWLPAVRRLMVRAVGERVPTLGICLGAQLLAMACGGRVERGASGLEVGLTDVRALPPADPFFGPIGNRLEGRTWPVRQFHRDAITALPPDAELLVTGKVYPNQGFRVGENAWAVQYHPEVSADGFEVWARRGLADPETVMGPIRRSEPIQDQMAQTHAASFASAVRWAL